MLENLAVVLIAPGLPLPVRKSEFSVDKPNWSTVPFIMADGGRTRRIEAMVPPA